MELRKFDIGDKAQKEFFEQVYNASFPARERRPLQYLYPNHTGNKPFTLYLIWEDGRPVGLMGVWHLSGFDYGEYFAVDPALRGRGIGQRALAMWLAQLAQPVLIEVEPPTDLAGHPDVTAQRRIDFYSRNGFRLWNIDYIQPTYHYNGALVPMRLMTFGEIDLAAQWERLRVDFFHEVYGVREEQIPAATGRLQNVANARENTSGTGTARTRKPNSPTQ